MCECCEIPSPAEICDACLPGFLAMPDGLMPDDRVQVWCPEMGCHVTDHARNFDWQDAAPNGWRRCP